MGVNIQFLWAKLSDTVEKNRGHWYFGLGHPSAHVPFFQKINLYVVVFFTDDVAVHSNLRSTAGLLDDVIIQKIKFYYSNIKFQDDSMILPELLPDNPPSLGKQRLPSA